MVAAVVAPVAAATEAAGDPSVVVETEEGKANRRGAVLVIVRLFA